MYRSPFLKAVKCTCAFKKAGSWSAGYHTGEDFVPADGDTMPALVSPADGTVLTNAYDASYGNYVVIRTTDGKAILMAHLKAKSTLAVGASVKAGTAIGTMGTTGNVTGAHLHIEVQNATTWSYNKNLLQPSKYIDFTNYSGASGGSSPLKAADLKGVPYKNGSTEEPTYMTVSDAASKKSSIGKLFQWESATCYAKVGSCYLLVYSAGSTKKAGLVRYNGCTSTPRTSGIAYQNGSTKEYIYATTADAAAKKNHIGYLNPREACECYGKAGGYYLLVYNAGGTKKVGFAVYSGGVT